MTRELEIRLEGAQEAARCEWERAEKAARYIELLRLSASYPGHEEFDENEWLELQRQLDAAEHDYETAAVPASPADSPPEGASTEEAA